MSVKLLLKSYAVKSRSAPFRILPSADGCGLSYACLRPHGWEIRHPGLLGAADPERLTHPTLTKMLQDRKPQAAVRQWGFDGGTVLCS